ncbi:hypothetical protein [Saccharopolyspora phatthalungensis]|uniref:Transposase n=1 Tax=Saccharopolyspora phatthalungensis TaxID=664693 RepID=A0A840Q3Q3_9PSEU|nr:hypothetical protein [Saccharopolyspora phatthalungensis]MBB5153005.1 hypothetical protein [Saccharopolyspora phatthalungensis]
MRRERDRRTRIADAAIERVVEQGLGRSRIWPPMVGWVCRAFDVVLRTRRALLEATAAWLAILRGALG